ncbi:Cys-tRNA(Pro)/Cys-tRNA(Cys) deacylase ybaK [Haploplasma axanthum]|uniref:Cys-tRNA(Pro)/Cys-tRNA(Cys) deacylase n=1 Tax=Haploplasma axanthum TaxID=29552 RepID=A0A449BDA9_HAPAX|nr:Cys-tRNA(Pro) deacylase [Haploplasma axanthum]VEU80451.1 Cys-tRNA(Pro)/Cys-tRNA(Cys) deacylase ybaK [Haploplasma axanthum]
MKTNAMRILDSKKIQYKVNDYSNTDAVSGVDVATRLGEDVNRVFKTLVTVAKSKKNYVFVIPVNMELDLKKAARLLNEKEIDMIKQKELLPLTGYVHGGCSPFGMKKNFETFFHTTALDYSAIMTSGGKVGYQIEFNFNDVKDLFDFKVQDIVKD